MLVGASAAAATVTSPCLRPLKLLSVGGAVSIDEQLPQVREPFRLLYAVEILVCVAQLQGLTTVHRAYLETLPPSHRCLFAMCLHTCTDACMHICMPIHAQGFRLMPYMRKAFVSNATRFQILKALLDASADVSGRPSVTDATSLHGTADSPLMLAIGEGRHAWVHVHTRTHAHACMCTCVPMHMQGLASTRRRRHFSRRALMRERAV